VKSKDIRDSFIKFFEGKNHKVVPSSSVVPYEDPTLLFTNAGMNQFKDVFLGTGSREYSRAVNSQKCIRAGGKHNDLEEVGMDGYHHTFFEMLGNWSFGDYYKKEAIKWAWELLTDVWKLPKERLWVSVYRTDEEALEYWKSQTDIDHLHILKFDEKDNFWEMGETGPCGPCSEIHFDASPGGCKAEDVNADREDVIEIWNLVFIQYNRNTKGELIPLPSKHVDTGMGLERVVRILQGKSSNYESDLFTPIIGKICEITGKKYEGDNISSINAIADHIRTLTFAISDGAIPSNEGRGYVLRRILRRAARLARKLDYNEPILHQLVDVVVDNFGSVYPELKEKKSFAQSVIKSEEESFNIALDRGLELFNEIYERIKNNPDKVFPGDEAFKLYDTYGFPPDLTQLIAKDYGFTVDMKTFDENMTAQKVRARSARKEDVIISDINNNDFEEIVKNLDPEYNPYDVTEDGVKTSLLKVNRIPNSDIEIIVVKNNPFYSESGGQISDTGKLRLSDGYELDVIDSKNNYYVYVKNPDQRNLFHKDVTAMVDFERRRSIQRNHSATHLVHEALRQVLGNHVKQMGSLVSEEHLRFDFPHFEKVSAERISEIEQLVNSKIKAGINVRTYDNLPIDEANNIPNVKKFFGEKYGSKVRVVVMEEDFSVEFCGGTHVANTNDIGLFKIVKEESISSGVRRIFARTGKGILRYIDEKITGIEQILNELPEKYSRNIVSEFWNFKKDYSKVDFLDAEEMANIIKYNDKTLLSLRDLREKYLEEKKNLDKTQRHQSLDTIFRQIDESVKKADTDLGFPLVTLSIELEDKEDTKEIAEYYKKVLTDGASLTIINIGGKFNIACYVSDTRVKTGKLNAGKIVSVIAKQFGGSGGGRPNYAVGGIKDGNNTEEIIKAFYNSVKDNL